MEFLRSWRKGAMIGLLCAGLVVTAVLPYQVDAATNTVATLVTDFVRTSSDSADAYVYAVCLAPSKIESKVTLEAAEAGSSDFEQAERPIRKTVYNATNLTQEIEYDIEEDLDYRIKVEVTDTYNGLSATVTTYHYLEDPVDSSAVSDPEWNERT